jgi:hypothetical protein
LARNVGEQATWHDDLTAGLHFGRDLRTDRNVAVGRGECERSSLGLELDTGERWDDRTSRNGASYCSQSFDENRTVNSQPQPR